MTTRTLSLRFSESDYLKLRQEAAALGLKPAVLARVIVRTSLNAPEDERRQGSARRFTAALDRLNRLVAGGEGAAVDPVDVINSVRQQRDDRLSGVVSASPSAR